MPQRIEDAFAARIATFATDVTDQALTPPSGSGQRGRSVSSRAPRAIRFGRFGSGRSEKIDKSGLAFPEPRRVRDHNHVRFTAKQRAWSVAGGPRTPTTCAFAQSLAIGRKASDEYTVPLRRGHHREVHRCEPVRWLKVRINPMTKARERWFKTHPLLA